MSLDEHRLLEADYGIVREVKPESNGGARYGVEITLPGLCDKCVIKDNCYGKGSMVWASGNESLRLGEAVCLEMKTGTVLKATAWVYGLPLVAVLLGTLLGHEILFDGMASQARVLLSFGFGVGLMGLVGIVMHRWSSWVSQRLRINAFRVGGTSSIQT